MLALAETYDVNIKNLADKSSGPGRGGKTTSSIDKEVKELIKATRSSEKATKNLPKELTTALTRVLKPFMQKAGGAGGVSSSSNNAIIYKVLKEIGIQNNANDHVLQLSEVALQANLDGIVCSVHEAKSVREKWGNAPLIVTPGIRMQKHNNDDQSRIATPLQARKSGSSFIVIGRPITQAADPILAIQQYFDDWESENS